MVRLDAWLVRRVEAATQWVQRLTGVPYWRQMRPVYATWALASVVADAEIGVDGFSVVLWVMIPLMTPIVWGKGAEADARALSGVANPSKVSRHDIAWRLFMTAILAISALLGTRSVWSWVSGPCFWLVLHMDACDALPPAPGRIGEWWRALTGRRVPAGAEA